MRRYIDMAPVGPDAYSGWSRLGHYVVGPSHADGRFFASFRDKRGKQTIIGRCDTVKCALAHVQEDASTRKG